MPDLELAVPVEPEMDTLLKALTEACQQISILKTTFSAPQLLTALDSSDLYMSTTTHVQIHDLGEMLNKLVVKDSRFLGCSVRNVRDDGGDSAFYPDFVGSKLIHRTLETSSPKAAIEWLKKVLGTSAAAGNRIQALWGAPVAEEIQLTPNVKIAPIDAVPDGKQKKWTIRGSHSRNNSPIMSMLNFTKPQSALMMGLQIDPFIYDPGTEQNFSSVEFTKAHELLLDITLALTVVGPRSVISAGQWFTFDDPDLEYAQLGISRSFPMLEILPNRPSSYPELDPIEAPKGVRGYLALHGKTRDKVRVALQRLGQAQRRHNVGDRAVELSTAFETLLGDNATSEMTHKIKVRSVRLLGGTGQVRKRNAAVINKAYDIRSRLVHTGHVDAAGTEAVCGHQMSVSEIINDTITMCADLIKVIIERGSIPDWSIFDITEQT